MGYLIYRSSLGNDNFNLVIKFITRPLILLLCVFLQTGIVFSQGAEEILREVRQHPAFHDADLGILVKNISTGEVIMQYQDSKRLTPASILKIKTVAETIKLFDATHRFSTNIYMTGHVEGGVLYGDIIIKGGGDPTLGSQMDDAVSIENISQDISTWLHEIQVTCIQGYLIADASYFSLPGVPAGYTHEDIGNYYGAGAFGLNIQDNAYEIIFERGKNSSVTVTSFDSMAVSTVSHGVVTRGRSDLAYIYPHPEESGVHVVGSLPVGSGAFSIRGAIKNPPLYAITKIQSQLESMNFEFNNKPHTSWYPTPIGNLLREKTYYSPTLEEIIKPILHKSNNVYAEVIFRHHQKKLRPHLSSEYRQLDGSGLSPENRISPKDLISVLEELNASEIKLLFNLLPQNGLEGTVKSVVKNKPGRLRVKSGSIGGVRTYMGLRRSDKSGDLIAFTCMANDLTVPGYQAIAAWNVVMDWIAEL